MSTVVGDEKLTSRENLIGFLFLYVQSDENTLPKVNKVSKTEALLTLGKDELQAIKDEDHGAEIICQFCQNKYEFSEADLEELIND